MNCQHTGHIGSDGAFFGDVGFMSSVSIPPTQPAPTVTHSSKPSLSRADSDASERAPLISVSSKKSNGSSSSSSALTSNAASHYSGGANKNPRMGYAIGYLRKSQNDSHATGNPSEIQGVAAVGPLTSANEARQPHEYQTISDEEFGCPPGNQKCSSTVF